MSDAKHTQGQFDANTGSPNWYGFEARFFEVTDKDGLIVCFVKEWTDAVEESKANARLFAAAPELLEALQELLSSVAGVPCGPEAKCRAAIAKATGATT